MRLGTGAAKSLEFQRRQTNKKKEKKTMFTITIKFNTASGSKLMSHVAGTIEANGCSERFTGAHDLHDAAAKLAERAAPERFNGDRELHEAIDRLTERELRCSTKQA